MDDSGGSSRRSARPARLPGALRPTVFDVAKASGLSRGTISRYLNDSGYVSPAARAAISAAIAEVGFAPSAVARSLATSKTGTVLFIVAEASGPYFADPNLSVMNAAASKLLSAADMQLVTIVIDGPRVVDRVGSLLRGGWADAVILAAIEPDHPLVAVIEALDLPAAMTGPLPAGSRISEVDVDNGGAMLELTRRVIDTGRTNTVMIGGPDRVAGARARREGVRAAFADGHPAMIVDAEEWTYEAGADAMRILLSAVPDLDSVIAASDALAFGALDVLRDSGREVPRDVSVAGFDDVPFAQYSRPPLTTVRQSFELMGEALAALVRDQLLGSDVSPGPVIVPTSIIWRDSV